MVHNQLFKVGARHAGKTVTVIIEDTHYRVQHGGESFQPPLTLGPITLTVSSDPQPRDISLHSVGTSVVPVSCSSPR